MNTETAMVIYLIIGVILALVDLGYKWNSSEDKYSILTSGFIIFLWLPLIFVGLGAIWARRNEQ